MIEQPMHEPLKKKCPKCGKWKLYQDLAGQRVFVYGDPQTLGHQAERNVARMSKDELAEKREKDGAVQKAKRDKRKSWYNPDGEDLKKELSKIDTPAKKHRYIMEGK